MKILCFDISSVLFRCYYANKNEDELTIAGLAQHQALLTLNKYYQLYRPDKVIMAYDRKAWRVDYTLSDKCISGKKYKGNRRQNMTDKERAKYEAFKEHLSQFEKLMKLHTSVVCLAGDQLEADDLIAGFVQQYASSENEIIMVSGDKDYIQNLGYINTKLIDPATGNERTLDEWEGSADLFMFIKKIRGDNGDNISSSFPRVRKTRLLKAWNDPLEMVNLMEENWTDQNGKIMLVKELFKENELLMDLSKQPQEWRDLIDKTINEAMEDPGKFSLFEFMRFLGKFQMNKVAENINTFSKMLSL